MAAKCFVVSRYATSFQYMTFPPPVEPFCLSPYLLLDVCLTLSFSFFLYGCLSLSVYLDACLSPLFLSFSLPMCLSFLTLFVSLFVRLSVCLPACLCLSGCFSLSLSLTTSLFIKSVGLLVVRFLRFLLCSQSFLPDFTTFEHIATLISSVGLTLYPWMYTRRYPCFYSFGPYSPLLCSVIPSI